MDKFMQQMREAFANEALWKEFQTGIWDTIYSTVAATLVACVLGIILGIILVAGEEDGVRPLPGLFSSHSCWPASFSDSCSNGTIL